MAESIGQTDRLLWNRVVDDDPAAWHQLVARYQALVYTVAIRCGLSMTDASDCFQQTWLALYRSRHQISDPAKLVAWLITTTRREAVRMIRRNGDPVDLDTAEEVATTDLSPDEQLESLERQLLLRAALDQLSERDRKLIEELFFVHHSRNYDEIAVALGVPVNSLGPMRQRCLAKLQKILKEMGLDSVRSREWLPLLRETYQAGKELRVPLEPPGRC